AHDDVHACQEREHVDDDYHVGWREGGGRRLAPFAAARRWLLIERRHREFAGAVWSFMWSALMIRCARGLPCLQPPWRRTSPARIRSYGRFTIAFSTGRHASGRSPRIPSRRRYTGRAERHSPASPRNATASSSR